MPVDKIRYFPPLGWGITQKGGGEYFEDYPTFVYKADVGGFQEKKSVYIATWVKTAFVTQCDIKEILMQKEPKHLCEKRTYYSNLGAVHLLRNTNLGSW